MVFLLPTSKPTTSNNKNTNGPDITSSGKSQQQCIPTKQGSTNMHLQHAQGTRLFYCLMINVINDEKYIKELHLQSMEVDQSVVVRLIGLWLVIKEWL